MNKSTTPKVSLIVPSWSGEISRLMTSVKAQTFQDYEVEVVRGVSPAARARNVGARRSKGDILLFIDDDAYFGHERVLETLVRLIEQDPTTGVVGTSKLAPEEATPLQKRIARQVPRMIYPVIQEDEESNPPLDHYGFTAVTTTCCAVRREAFDLVNGFDEQLTTGPEDTDFFYRLRREGYRIMVAGGCWVYHDPPSSVRDLLRKSFWYGIGHALEARKNPERGMGVLPLDKWYGKISIPVLTAGFPFAFFIHPYFDPVRRLEFGFRPFKTLSTYSVLAGYVYGWYRGKPQKATTTYMGRQRAEGSDETAGTGEASKKPVRVLIVDVYPKIGGGQQVLLSVVREIDRARYEPVVALPPQSPLRARIAAEHVKSVGVPFSERNMTLPKLKEPGSVLSSLRSVAVAMKALVRVARREKIDIIHANSAVAGVHALPVAMLLGVPCVVHSHDFLTAQATNRVLKWMIGYRRSAMIFVSQALARYYNAEGGKYLYRVIHNGIDTRRFKPDNTAKAGFTTEFSLPEDCFLIGAVGRLEAGKGFSLLLEAFSIVVKTHPQARLALVGDVVFSRLSSARRELQEKVERLGIKDKVVFTGFRDDMPRVMAALDVLVHCPIEPEGFGLILAEAMSCGRPVVAVPEGGITEVVTNEKNGLLVAAGDAEAIAAAITRLIRDPDLGRRLGAAGRRTVEEHFSVKGQAQEVERLYDEMLERENKRGANAHDDPIIEVGSASGD